jgi:hypothetical protein
VPNEIGYGRNPGCCFPVGGASIYPSRARSEPLSPPVQLSKTSPAVGSNFDGCDSVDSLCICVLSLAEMNLEFCGGSYDVLDQIL